MDVCLREDGDDLSMQVIPEAHLAHIELMKRDGCDMEEETVLRVELGHVIDRQDDEVTIAQN
ncbi:hypothetical protein WME75_31745 [Sorangium sp. So ce1014]|uniref:hypothetical protein n=1 Tax=Sorangium sp. So ce1014 TaxID=3133326 RepID=UPI003F62ECF6